MMMRLFRWAAFLCLAAVGLGLANDSDEGGRDGPGPMDDFSMTRYKWKNRPVLIFTRSPDDARLREFKEDLRERREGVEDRDMVLIEVPRDAPSRAEGRVIPVDEAAKLRERFEVEDVDADAFAVVLVGKDGTEKERWDEPVDLGVIFSKIDAMPMRQREMGLDPGEGGPDAITSD